MIQKRILILGGGGFIGHHLAKRLKDKGAYVCCVDIKNYEDILLEFKIKDPFCDNYIRYDLRTSFYDIIKSGWDEIYQLAADMGGAGYIFTGENDTNVMLNSAQININLITALIETKTIDKVKVFYSSSACIYPRENQLDPLNPNCKEESAYPANPDSEYGWEKLFSERLYLAANRNFRLNVRVARFHNIFGPEGTWKGGKEKAPAAICRKVLESKDKNGEVEVWGPGTQTRSFLFIEDCLDGVEALMKSNFLGPVNIGSEEMVTINELVRMAAKNVSWPVKINNIPGPVGVLGRNSDNTLCKKELWWAPKTTLQRGLNETFYWIKFMMED